MNSRTVVGAVDIGASGGRVMAGLISDERIDLEEVHRFPNGAALRHGRLRWDLTSLFEEVLIGLTRLAERFPDVVSIGIDTWAVDYGLLDADGRLVAEPVAHRDTRTADVIDAVHSVVGRAELFGINGLQFLPFTTLYQLVAEQSSPDWQRARHALLLPDLLTHWLTGELSTEYTNASTTGLVDVRTRAWSTSLFDRLGIPADLFAALVEPGTPAGALHPDLVRRTGLSSSVVVTKVASHDTASAVVGVPMTDTGSAYVSSGTWSLVGVETTSPVLSEAALAAEFTNEGGVDGTVRFLRNVGGLWLLQECLRSWAEEGRRLDLSRLLAEAEHEPADVAVFPVDDPLLVVPGDMPSRVNAAVLAAGGAVPQNPPAVVRAIVDSLAHGYARTIDTAGTLTGRPVSRVHVVGGGSQNALLCRRTAEVTGLPVLAGPVEATALGNVAVQARALGVAPRELADLRCVIAASTAVVEHRPTGHSN